MKFIAQTYVSQIDKYFKSQQKPLCKSEALRNGGNEESNQSFENNGSL